jgi:hypothetical protein
MKIWREFGVKAMNKEKIYILKGSIEYPKNTYYLNIYNDEEEAILNIKEMSDLKNCIFIKGKELDLCITDKKEK